MRKIYLVEEAETGYLDGYFYNRDEAELCAGSWNERRPRYAHRVREFDRANDPEIIRDIQSLATRWAEQQLAEKIAAEGLEEEKDWYVNEFAPGRFNA